jgi:amino acid transporter
MAEQKELPQILARTHAKFKTPYISLLLTAVVIFIFTLQTSFYAALTIATITRLLVYATTCASLPVFRLRGGAPEAKFIAPFGMVAAIFSLLSIAWLLTNVDFKREGLAILIAAAVGLALYFVYQFWNKRFAAKTV